MALLRFYYSAFLLLEVTIYCDAFSAPLNSDASMGHRRMTPIDRVVPLQSTAGPQQDPYYEPETVVVGRSLYRFTADSPIQSKLFVIEESQFFSLTPDANLSPLSPRAVTFRIAESDTEVKIEDKGNEKVVYNKIGPALLAINGMQEKRGENEDARWDKYYAMALFAISYPEYITGEGIEIGR